MSPSRRGAAGGLVGFHVSTLGSYSLAVDRAQELGCTTFQIFTSNPRVWRAPPIRPESALAFRERRLTAGFRKVVSHIPYLPNLASSDPALMKMSRAALKVALQRSRMLGVDYLVIHLGSYGEEGKGIGMKHVAEACNEALASSERASKEDKTMLLLENMAGQGTGVGSRFEEVASILDGIKEEKLVGVCFDTCHAFVAGYDISTKAGVHETMDAFDSAVGLARIKVVHLNDSKMPLGSRLDRHARIGQGHIGAEGFKAFLRYKNLGALALIMEPSEHAAPEYMGDLQIVRKLAGNAASPPKTTRLRRKGPEPYL